MFKRVGGLTSVTGCDYKYDFDYIGLDYNVKKDLSNVPKTGQSYFRISK